MWLFIAQFWIFFSEMHDVNINLLKSELRDINSQFYHFSCNCEYIFRNSDFFSENCDINSQLWVIMSNSEGKRTIFLLMLVYIMQFWLYKSQLWVYITQFWEKSLAIVRIKVWIVSMLVESYFTFHNDHQGVRFRKSTFDWVHVWFMKHSYAANLIVRMIARW